MSDRIETAQSTTLPTEPAAPVYPVGVFRTDSEGDYVYVNDLWCRTMGLTPERARGRGWADALHADDRDRVWDEWTEAVLNKRPFHSEYRFVRESGVTAWVSNQANVEFDASRRVTGYVGIITEITERKRAEDLLRIQRQVLEMIAVGAGLKETLDELCLLIEFMVAQSVCSVMLVDERTGCLDLHAGPTVPTEMARAMAGLVPGVLAASCGTAVFLGENVIVTDTETDPRWENLRDVALRFGVKACWSAPMLHGGGSAVGTFAISHPTRRSPSVFHRQVLETASSLAGIAIQHDRSGRALAARESAIRLLHEVTSAQGVGFAERVRRLLSVGCDVLGLDLGILSRVDGERYEAVHVHARCETRVTPGAVCDLAKTYCRETLRAEEPVGFEHACGDWLNHPAYEATRFEAYVGTRVLVGSEVFGTLCFSSAGPRRIPFSDTDKNWLQLSARWVGNEIRRQQAEQQSGALELQLRQSQKMEAMGQLAGGVAHDFNNLLTVILGNARMILGSDDGRPGATDPLAVRECTEQIHRACLRAESLTRQLLTFSRKQVTKPEILDPNQVVLDMLEMLGRSIGEHIELVTELAPDVCRIYADRGQLEQVIVNLALNARDAMQEGGRMTLRTAPRVLDEDYVSTHLETRPGLHATITIEDTGHGMDRDTLTRIFDPFFTTKPVGKGTGLGLSTVYGMVSRQGGHVTVDSAPGKGSSFRVHFPAAPERTAISRNRSTGKSGVGNETVLLCEDEPLVRDLAAKVLEDGGYRVIRAENGKQALRAIEGHQGAIDLLVSDVIMPEMNGRQLAEALTKLYPKLRVLLMSGYTSDVISPLGVVEGEYDLLEKPFGPEVLLQRVRRVLDAAD